MFIFGFGALQKATRNDLSLRSKEFRFYLTKLKYIVVSAHIQ